MGAGVRDLLSLLTHGERVRMALLSVSMLFNAALGIVGLSSVMPFIYLVVADAPLEGDALPARLLRMVGFHDANTALTVVGVGIVGVVAFKCAYAVFHALMIDRFTAVTEVRLATKLLRRIVDAPYSWLTTQNASVLREIALARTSECARGSLRTLLQLVSDTFFLLFAAITIISISPGIGLLVTLVACLLAMGLLWGCRSALVRLAERKRIYARRALLSATDAIMGGRDVRMSQAGRMLVSAFKTDQLGFAAAEVRGRLFQALPRNGTEVIGIALLVGLGLGLLWSGLPKSEIAAILVLYGLLVVRALPVISTVVNSVATLSAHMPAIVELTDFLRLITNLTPDIKEAPATAFSQWREVALERVGFGYPEAEKPAVAGLDLTIRRGERIGVVGSSGAGKSTLIDLLVGLLHPTEGAIRIDDTRLTAETERAWQQQIGYVAQAPFLVDGTLLDNVTLGAADDDNREERCLNALRAAGLGPVVDSLPQGILSRVGDFGAKLSGGQRQRVAVARALYRRASILVLDEATSALDSVTEREVVDGIFALGEDVTIVIIAHRLSLVQRCDKIAVLDRGRLVAQGTHQELLEGSELYLGLVRAQSLDD